MWVEGWCYVLVWQKIWLQRDEEEASKVVLICLWEYLKIYIAGIWRKGAVAVGLGTTQPTTTTRKPQGKEAG